MAEHRWTASQGRIFATSLALGLLFGCAKSETPSPKDQELLNQQFLRAARAGDVIGCAELHTHGASLEAKLEQDGTLLAGYLPREGSTAIHIAIAQKNPELLGWLLTRGANPDARDGLGYTPLEIYFQTPIATGPEGLAVTLITHQATVNTHSLAHGDPKKEHLGATPLHFAAEQDLRTVAGALLEHHAGVNDRTADGSAALHWAMTGDMIRLLVQGGGDLEAVDGKGQTPFVSRVTLGDFGTAAVLLEAGAKGNPALPDSLSGTTILHVIIGSVEVETHRVQVLALVKSLIRHGADIQATDAADQSPLYYASSLSGEVVVDLALVLLESGADPNRKDLHARTPLHAACLRDSARLVRALIAKGARVDQADDSGITPLHQACSSFQGNPAVLQALVAAAADIHARDSEGREPLDYVRTEDHGKVERLLRGE